MINFQSISGIIIAISDLLTVPEKMGCYKIISIQKMDGEIVNFIISPETYFVDRVMVRPGDMVSGFYDSNDPAPLIYPPQYQAVVMARAEPGRNVKVDFFDEDLVSSDGLLKLNLAPPPESCSKTGKLSPETRPNGI